jgi:hypothetical protein
VTVENRFALPIAEFGKTQSAPVAERDMVLNGL